MQKDSVHFSTTDHMPKSQAAHQEPQSKLLQCHHCSLFLKSKAYLFEHLSEVHSLAVDAALTDAGLKHHETNKTKSDDYSNNSEDLFACQHDFEAFDQNVLKEAEDQRQRPSADQNSVRNHLIVENKSTKILVVLKNNKEGEKAKDKSTSKTQCNSSKDLKTYKRPLQTITKYLEPSSGFKRKPSVDSEDNSMFVDGTKETLLLRESPSNSSPSSSGVFQVTAKPTIDILKNDSTRCLLNDHLLVPNLKPQKPKGQFNKTVSSKGDKSPGNENCEGPPGKKAKSDTEETKLPEKVNASKQQTSGSMDLSLEFSEGEEENKLQGGDTETSVVYLCKQCDFSAVGLRPLSAHYQKNHPHIRFNTVYLQDPTDCSATFRCLECPVEFPSVAELKRHHAENHLDALNVLTMKSHDLSLVFKCFVCPFNTDVLKALKDHYREKHPTHKVANSLMYCRYLAAKSPEGSSQLSESEKVLSQEKTGDRLPESTQMICKEVRKTTSTQNSASIGAEVALYHCKKCNFSHKSVVVMHVHYQKSHPEEAVTIDKIKQSAVDPSNQRSVTEQTSPNQSHAVSTSTQSQSDAQTPRTTDNLMRKRIKLILKKPLYPQVASKTHCETFQTKKRESAQARSEGKESSNKCNGKMSPDPESISSSSPNKMFYCRLCSFSSPEIKSVVGHQNTKHPGHKATYLNVASYSVEVQEKNLRDEVALQTQPSESETFHQVDVFGEEQLQRENERAANAPDNAFAHPERLYYCQKCNMGADSIQGILKHQNRLHKSLGTGKEVIIKHTAVVQAEIKKLKAQNKGLASYLPLPFINKGDKDLLFCHLCHYRNNSCYHVLRHYLKRHPGFEVQATQVSQYSSWVFEKIKNSHLCKTSAQEEATPPSLWEVEGGKKKEEKLVKVLELPKIQRSLKCHECPYVTQHLYLFRRHLWQIHKEQHTVREVLQMCYKEGFIQAGYHCEMCVFSHDTAKGVHDHYMEKHPKRPPSLEYISAHLHVAPKSSRLKKRSPPVDQTEGGSDADANDDGLPSKISGQNEVKTFSCKACSFKSESMSDMTEHYRGVHPWSVKEDGSVLDVVNRKAAANRHLDDDGDIPASFEAYQVPLDIDSSLEMSSPKNFRCSECPAEFHTQRRLNIHIGIKHKVASNEELSKNKDLKPNQHKIQKLLHVFKCPYCTYLNTSYHGVLTHCQMRHVGLESRAESLQVDKDVLSNLEDCLKRKGQNFRLSGYMCTSCPQIFFTLKKLNRHCEKNHNYPAANPAEIKPKPPQVKIRNNLGSISKASFLRKKHCSYKGTMKIVLGRQLLVHHNEALAAKAQSPPYTCTICSSTYSFKKQLGRHYVKKHGKKSYHKYFLPLYKKLKPTSQESSEEAEEARILVYKCPHCLHVNTNQHGTYIHCQMSHHSHQTKVEELETEEVLVSNMIRCSKGTNSNPKGFRCEDCPQIHGSMKKLRIHRERVHGETTTPEQPVKTEAENHETFSFQESVLEAFTLKTEISEEEVGLSQHLETSTSHLSKSKEALFQCSICPYTGVFRRYLQSHYKKFHKLDVLATHNLLKKYNKERRSNVSDLLEAQVEETGMCKICPELKFDSPELLIGHYKTVHNSDRLLDFTILSKGSKNTTGLYKCTHCQKQLNGIRKMVYHLDKHREAALQWADISRRMNISVKTEESFVHPDEEEEEEEEVEEELPVLEAVEGVSERRETGLVTMDVPKIPAWSPLKPAALERLEDDSGDEPPTCRQCGRTFMSVKGLRSHERSHAALAALRKHSSLPASLSKNKINKYLIYKCGNTKPFVCSFCSYRTNVMGLWRRHFMKNHQDVLEDPAENEDQDDESAQSYADGSDSEEPEGAGQPETNKRSLYSEPHDVQRQLSLYNLMAAAAAKGTLKDSKSPEDSLLHCEICDFNTEHLSSIRRHYLNRHGKKMLRCKDCNFFTCSRKTLDMHLETDHSTCQPERSHLKDFSCPFCLYQTRNKNRLIDHIVLHREERVVPMEVRRPKLSRYLQGLVFRCHACTFTSGSAENLRVHMKKHDGIRPFKCRLCFFDCTRLSDLEAHLSDKHQVLRNHELVGQVSLDELEERAGRMGVEEEKYPSDSERPVSHSQAVKTEELIPDGDEAPEETRAEHHAEIRSDKMSRQTLESPQEQRKDEGQLQSWILDHQYENTKKGVMPGEERLEFLQNSARENEEENPEKQNVTAGKSAAMDRLTEESQAQKVQKVQKDGKKSFTDEKEELEKRSSCDPETETDSADHLLLLNDEGNAPKIHRPANQDQDIKMEETLAEEDGISKDNNNSVKDTKHQETLKTERDQQRINQEDNSETDCKKELFQAQKPGEEERDPYGEMPVLENEFLKEETVSPGLCKEGDEENHLEREQDEKDKMICEEEDGDGRVDQEEGDGMKDADETPVSAGRLTVLEDAVTHLSPAPPAEKPFTCDLCGRNLLSSSDLERHMKRHGR